MGSAVLIVWILHRVDWSRLSVLLRAIDRQLAGAASALVLPLILLLAIRWRLFLRQQSIPIPSRTVGELTWAGQFFNSILPGSTGGDVIKIYQLCRLYPDRKAAAATSVIVDRLMALMALLLLAVIGISQVLPKGMMSLLAWPSISPWTVVAITVVLAVAIVVARHFFRGRPIRKVLSQMIAPLKLALAPNRYLPVGFTLAILVHLLSILGFYLFARSLGINIAFVQVLLIMPVILLCSLVPLTVNGHGLREALLTYYFAYLQISVPTQPDVHIPEMVVALSALLVTNDLLWSLPGGLFYLAVLRKQPEIRT